MVTIGILAILAAIAIPSYQSYALKSHRTEAKTALLDLASMEERFLSTNYTYSAAPSDLGYTGANFPINTVSNYYQINWTFGNPPTAAVPPTAAAPAGTPAFYSFTAKAIGAQAADALVELLDGGATVPFIAHYRKEATGALDDAQLRTLDDRRRNGSVYRPLSQGGDRRAR